MFDSLDEQIKHDSELQTTKAERWFLRIAVPVVAVLVFSALYFGVRLLE